MNKEEIKNKISEHKECCKKLAEEYRQRYNEDKTDKLALNMFYHNVIAYNDFENVLAMIEDRNSMMLCFAEPPILTEKTVEVDINRIAELEQKISVLLSCKNCPENKGGYICEKEYEDKCLAQKMQFIKDLQQENAELRTKTAALENANTEMVKELDDMTSGGVSVLENVVRSKEQLTKAKEIIKLLLHALKNEGSEYTFALESTHPVLKEAEQFLKESE